MAAERILVGEIGRPHGVRGLVKLRSFTADPAAVASYGPLTDETGERRFALDLLGDGVARVEGVSDREAAAHLGETATVVGTVAAVFRSRKGTVYLNFGADYPHQTFTAVALAPVIDPAIKHRIASVVRSCADDRLRVALQAAVDDELTDADLSPLLRRKVR